MKSKAKNVEEVWVVTPVLGKTRFPVSSPLPFIDWKNNKATPIPGKKTFSRFVTDCTRCRSCEIICALSREKVNNPAFSRIRVLTSEREWIEGKSERIVERKICRQCPESPECMQACPVEGALTRDSKTGAVIVNQELCIRCKSCVKACPYDALWYNEQADKILKCDLCGGKPQCVIWCPVECLKFERYP